MTLTRQFSTRQILNILEDAGLQLDIERLKVWHRRGFAPGERVGKGNERLYTLTDLIKIASLVFISRRVGQFRDFGPAVGAYALATDMAKAVLAVYETGPDPNVARTTSVYVMSEKRVGTRAGRHGLSIDAPSLAVDVAGSLRFTAPPRLLRAPGVLAG